MPAGHRDTFFGAWRGDAIDLRKQNGDFRYSLVFDGACRSRRCSQSPSNRADSLTLVTCYPFQFLGAAPKGFVVRAECAECPRRP